MKIAHVVWSMLTGGIETMLVNIINEQVKTENVSLYIINDIWYEPLLNQLSDKCIVKLCGRRKGGLNPIPFVKLNYWLWKQAPDIVHVHSYRLSDVILNRRHMVRTIHSTRNNSREYSRMKALYSISESVRQSTLSQGYDSVVIENGINYSNFIQKQNHSKRKIWQFVQVGRLNINEKGQDILIKAVKELVRNHGNKNFHVTFIGEGESRNVLEQMTKENNISQYVSFVGRKNQSWLYEHLSDYDCFVMPSRFEGFGLTVAEAMAAKLPILVSNIEGPMEIINHGKYGMSFTNGDHIDLANKMQQIINGGYDYSKIDMACEWVRKKYDISETARNYIEEYKRLLK